MKNKKAEDMLNDEVKQKDILNFIDKKYNSYKLVNQRTVQRWLKELGIECIEPRPNRNKDIRYRKSDVLKLVKMKETNLLRKKNKELKHEEKKKIATDARTSEQNYNDSLAGMTHEEKRQQDINEMFDYSVPATEKIKEDKLEMCFNELFPNVSFDKEYLEKLLFIKNERSMHSESEYGQAMGDLKSKAYIRNDKN